MLRRTLVPALALALPAIAFAQSLSTDPKTVPTGVYEIEPGHTSVCFGITHLGLSTYPGCFTKVSGNIGFDSKHLEGGKADVSIDLASLWTASDKLTAELRKDVFKADSLKTATFRSTSAKVTGPNAGTITGTLNMNGVSKPVTLKVMFKGSTLHPFAKRTAIGFNATGAIKRSDFGLDNMPWSAFVSDEVQLTIAAEAIAKE